MRNYSSRYHLPFMLYTIFMFLATHLPAPDSTPSIEHGDKVVHFFLYFFFSLLLFRLVRYYRYRKSTVITVFFSAFIYAFIDEFLQHYIPGRFFSMYDFLFNIIGFSTGFLFYFRRLFYAPCSC